MTAPLTRTEAIDCPHPSCQDGRHYRCVATTEWSDPCSTCAGTGTVPLAIELCACGLPPSVRPDLAGYGFIASCDDCYDGAPDSGGRYAYGFGPDREQAIAEWNEITRDNAEALGVCLHCRRAPCAGAVEGEFGVRLCASERAEGMAAE